MRTTAQRTLQDRTIKKSKAKGSWITGFSYALTAAAGAFGLAKLGLLTAVCAVVGGPIAAACIVVALGVGVTACGYLKGKTRGERLAQNLDTAVVEIELDRMRFGTLDFEGLSPDLITAFKSAWDNVERTIEKHDLPEHEYTVVLRAMLAHLREQHDYFGTNYSAEYAACEAERFGKHLGKHLFELERDTPRTAKKGRPLTFINSAVADQEETDAYVACRELLKRLVDPQSSAVDIARCQTQVLVHWNRYLHFSHDKDFGARIKEWLKGAHEFNNVEKSYGGGGLKDSCLDDGKPIRQLCIGARRFKDWLLYGRYNPMERVSSQRNDLLRQALVQLSEGNPSLGRMEDGFKSLERGEPVDGRLDEQDKDEPTDLDIFAETSELAAVITAVQYKSIALQYQKPAAPPGNSKQTSAHIGGQATRDVQLP